MPEPLSGLGALAPGRKRAYADAVAQGQADYEQATAAHAQAEQRRRSSWRMREQNHETALAPRAGAHPAPARCHRPDGHATSPRAGARRSPITSARCWPCSATRATSRPASRSPTCPPTGRSSSTSTCRCWRRSPSWNRASTCPKKTLRHKKLTAAARNKLYQQVIAQMALRTLRCVFAADRGGLVRTAACNGYVDTINTATGQPARWCLVSVQVDRDLFDGLDLARVDPMDCLAYLHAKISKTPEKYQPVQPIIEYPWDDLHYAEELDAAADLDSVQNLLDLDGYEFEQLLAEALPGDPRVRRGAPHPVTGRRRHRPGRGEQHTLRRRPRRHPGQAVRPAPQGRHRRRQGDHRLHLAA